MKHLKKITTAILFCFIVFLITPTTAFAQDIKVGYVQVDSVASLMPEYKAAQSKLEEFERVIQKNLQTKAQQAQARGEELQRQAPTMTETQRQQAQAEIQKLQEDFNKEQQQANEQFNKRQQDLLFPIYEKIREAIKVVGKENNYAIIFNELDGTKTAYILYAADGADATGLVIKQLGLSQN